MKVAISGATGYIGERLVSAARRAGYEVLALSRRAPADADVAWLPFELADPAPLSLPADVVAVFHLAAVTHSPAGSDAIEEAAALRLIAAAAAVGARFVFVSSQTAAATAPTPYGRTKWAIEQHTLQADGAVVRPGQVYGGPESGLFGVLCRLVRRLPVVPAFVPQPQVQPVHVDDLAAALLATLPLPPQRWCVAAPEGVAFLRFLQTIARGRTRRRVWSVPVPTVLVRMAAKVIGPTLSERLGLPRLLSLFALPPMATAADLEQLGLTLRPLAAGMSRSGGTRRELLREGRALLGYILRTRPTDALLRRYVSAVEQLRSGVGEVWNRQSGAAPSLPLPLPWWAVRWPWLVGVFDGSAALQPSVRDEFDWRLAAALRLAEASPQGARRFLAVGGPEAGWHRVGSAVIRMGWAVWAEVLRRLLQVALRPWLCRLNGAGTERGAGIESGVARVHRESGR